MSIAQSTTHLIQERIAKIDHIQERMRRDTAPRSLQIEFDNAKRQAAGLIADALFDDVLAWYRKDEEPDVFVVPAKPGLYVDMRTEPVTAPVDPLRVFIAECTERFVSLEKLRSYT